MKSKQSFEPCYNARAVVEEADQLIVAQEVGRSAADNELLAPLLDQVKQNTRRKPHRVLAVAGQKGEKNCQALEKRKIRWFVAHPWRPWGAECADFAILCPCRTQQKSLLSVRSSA